MDSFRKESSFRKADDFWKANNFWKLLFSSSKMKFNLKNLFIFILLIILITLLAVNNSEPFAVPFVAPSSKTLLNHQ